MLLDGVLRTRGRLWLAGRPDHAMWLESAGAGLRVSSAGRWLAALSPPELAGVDPERRAFAELEWDAIHGDRHTSMTILVCGADVTEIVDALRGALLTDDELDGPARTPYDDPFGDWHDDPRAEPAQPAQENAAPANHRPEGDR